MMFCCYWLPSVMSEYWLHQPEEDGFPGSCFLSLSSSWAFFQTSKGGYSWYCDLSGGCSLLESHQVLWWNRNTGPTNILPFALNTYTQQIENMNITIFTLSLIGCSLGQLLRNSLCYLLWMFNGCVNLQNEHQGRYVKRQYPGQCCWLERCPYRDKQVMI